MMQIYLHQCQHKANGIISAPKIRYVPAQLWGADDGDAADLRYSASQLQAVGQRRKPVGDRVILRALGAVEHEAQGQIHASCRH